MITRATGVQRVHTGMAETGSQPSVFIERCALANKRMQLILSVHGTGSASAESRQVEVTPFEPVVQPWGRLSLCFVGWSADFLHVGGAYTVNWLGAIRTFSIYLSKTESFP